MFSTPGLRESTSQGIPSLYRDQLGTRKWRAFNKPLHLPLHRRLQGWLLTIRMKSFSNNDADDTFSFLAGFNNRSFDTVESFTRS